MGTGTGASTRVPPIAVREASQRVRAMSTRVAHEAGLVANKVKGTTQ